MASVCVPVLQVVCCDPDRLRGVLLNLYTNAGEPCTMFAPAAGCQLYGDGARPPCAAGMFELLLSACWHQNMQAPEHDEAGTSSCTCRVQTMLITTFVSCD